MPGLSTGVVLLLLLFLLGMEDLREGFYVADGVVFDGDGSFYTLCGFSVNDDFSCG